MAAKTKKAASAFEMASKTDLSSGTIRARIVVSIELKEEITRAAIDRRRYPNQVIAALLGTHAGSVLADFDGAVAERK